MGVGVAGGLGWGSVPPPTLQLLSFCHLPKGSADEQPVSHNQRQFFWAIWPGNTRQTFLWPSTRALMPPIPNTGWTAFMELPGQFWLHPSFTSMATVDSAPTREQLQECKLAQPLHILLSIIWCQISGSKILGLEGMHISEILDGYCHTTLV